MLPDHISDAIRAMNAAEDKRSFICPCGKSYLSYPALFTHIKQKHNGNVKDDKIVGSRQSDKA